MRRALSLVSDNQEHDRSSEHPGESLENPWRIPGESCAHTRAVHALADTNSDTSQRRSRTEQDGSRRRMWPTICSLMGCEVARSRASWHILCFSANVTRG